MMLISRDWEMARSQSVPYVPNLSTKVRRPSQWLQQSREDSRVNNFFLGGSKQWGTPAHVVHDTSAESDDLQAMVHDFIENDCVDLMDGVEGDGGSPGLTLSENLQMLAKPHSTRERELLAKVQWLLQTVNNDTDLICDTNGTDCQGTCIRRVIVKHLKTAAYTASVCKSKWLSSGRVPGGEYEYIDVVLEGDHQSLDRLLVDINFQSQFEIARPTAQYRSALKSLPTVFVGTTPKLEQVLRLMSEAAKVSLDHNEMHLPPWRTLDYMRAKWLSKFERRPCDARHCSDELRLSKVSLLLETKGSSALFNLPRGEPLVQISCFDPLPRELLLPL